MTAMVGRVQAGTTVRTAAAVLRWLDVVYGGADCCVCRRAIFFNQWSEEQYELLLYNENAMIGKVETARGCSSRR